MVDGGAGVLNRAAQLNDDGAIRGPERDDTRITEVIPRCASDSARGDSFARAAGRASERRRDRRVRASSREIRGGAGAGFGETRRRDGVLREP